MAGRRRLQLRVVRGGDVPAEHRGLAAIRSIVSIAGRMNGAMAGVAKGHGLTLPHLEVLLCLKGGEGISQQELSDRLLVTKGNTCVIVQKVEAAGLIDRRPDPADQRTHRLYLTDDGHRLLARVRPGLDALTARLVRGLTPAERTVLHELLCRVEDAFDDVQA
jgi:DNA-binding MarR family transcriptional regulator